MEQYNSIQQLLKKEAGHKDRLPVFPPTVIQAVFDGKTGASLEAILAQFNSIYIQYQGSPMETRNIIPVQMRRAGLTITYMNMDSETITERANSAAQKDNNHWGLDTNWSRVDELTLSGEISVSVKGTWIINGEDTGIKAVGPKGDTGLTPWLKTIDNRLHFSYDGITWEPCSDYIAHYFRVHNNMLQISHDNINWETLSDFIAAYFRFVATASSGQEQTIGKIQISRDNKTWADLSPEFTNNLRIKAYVATKSALPGGQATGTIYGVGPTYAAEDTGHTNPIYRIYVYDGSKWVDNGVFTSIAAGVVQETGDSETEVMSQKAVTDKLSELGADVDRLKTSKLVNLSVISSTVSEYSNIGIGEFSYNPSNKLLYKNTDGTISYTEPRSDSLYLYNNTLLSIIEGRITVKDNPINILAWDSAVANLMQAGKGSIVYNLYNNTISIVTESQLWNVNYDTNSLFIYEGSFYVWDTEKKTLVPQKDIQSFKDSLKSLSELQDDVDKISSDIGVFKETTLTKNDFVGLYYKPDEAGGGVFVDYTSLDFDGIIVPIRKGATYIIKGGLDNLKYSVLTNELPKEGISAPDIGVGGFPYTSDGEYNYLFFNVRISTFTSIVIKEESEGALKDIDTLKDAAKDIENINEVIDNMTYKEAGEEIPFDILYNVLLSPGTGKETEYDNAEASDYIDISGNSAIYISASMSWSNALYVFYDRDKKYVSGRGSAGGSAITIMVQERVVVPANAVYVRVCQYAQFQRAKVYKEDSYINIKPWNGKKWVCIGDSLTEKNIRASMNYHDYVANATGVEVINMGVSGTGYKRGEENGNAFYQRVQNIPLDADVYTIFGSGNDGAYWGNSLGTASDTGTETLGGCINTCIDNLLSIKPLAVIGIISPTPWGSYNPSTENAMKRYSNLLKEICEARGIPFLNLYLNSGLRPWDETFRSLAYSRDEGGSVHPDENGHKLIAPRFKAFLETLIM